MSRPAKSRRITTSVIIAWWCTARACVASVSPNEFLSFMSVVSHALTEERLMGEGWEKGGRWEKYELRLLVLLLCLLLFCLSANRVSFAGEKPLETYTCWFRRRKQAVFPLIELRLVHTVLFCGE